MDPIKLNIHRKSNRCQLFRVACKLLTEILPMSWKNTHTTKEDYSEKLMKTFTYDSKLPKCFRFVTCAEKLDHFGNGHKTGKPNIYQQCSHSSRHFIVTRTMHLQQQRYLKEHQLKQKYIHALGEVGSSIEYIFHALLYGIFCTKNHKKYGYSSTCHEYIVEVEVQLHSFLMELRNEWLAPQPGHFIPEERAPGMYCIEVAWDPGLVWMFWRREKSCASARNRDLDHPVHRLVTVKTTLFQLSPKDDMHSKCLLISFLLFVINLLVPINTYTALQGAGFNLLTQHMCWPIIVIPVQPCWAVFPLLMLQVFA